MAELLIAFYYLLWLLNVLMVIAKKNSREISAVTFITMGFIFVTNAATEGDAQIYKYDFEQKVYGDKWVEPGYILFRSIFQECGITDFNVYLFFVFIITGILFYKGISYYTNNYHAIFAVVMGYIWVGSNQGIRFFVASAVYFYAIHFITERKIGKYILVTLIASLIHRSLLFMLLYPLLMSIINHVRFGSSVFGHYMKRAVVIGALGISGLFYALQRIPGIEIAYEWVRLFSDAGAHKIQAYGYTMTKMGGDCTSSFSL